MFFCLAEWVAATVLPAGNIPLCHAWSWTKRTSNWHQNKAASYIMPKSSLYHFREVADHAPKYEDVPTDQAQYQGLRNHQPAINITISIRLHYKSNSSGPLYLWTWPQAGTTARTGLGAPFPASILGSPPQGSQNCLPNPSCQRGVERRTN